MTSLLIYKEKLKAFYGKYDGVIVPLIKFILVFLAALELNIQLGYMDVLNNPFIPVIVGLVCCMLPYGASSLILAGYMLLHVGNTSMEMVVVMALIILVIGVLYYGFQPGDSYILIIVPLLFFFKIPYVIALLVGLGASLVTIIPVSCGVLIYYLISYVKINSAALNNDNGSDIAQKYQQIINGVFSNQRILMMILVLTITILVVYFIHNLSINYAWLIAIGAGVITLLVTLLIGQFTFDESIPIVELVVGMIVSAIVAVVYQFFVFSVDYTRTEYTQFEDDDYYYYVKAVPKVSLSAPDVKIQKINTIKTDQENEKKDEE